MRRHGINDISYILKQTMMLIFLFLILHSTTGLIIPVPFSHLPSSPSSLCAYSENEMIEIEDSFNRRSFMTRITQCGTFLAIGTITAAYSATAATITSTPTNNNISIEQLLNLIPSMPNDAPATPFTVGKERTISIESIVTSLERQQKQQRKNNVNLVLDPNIAGPWRLLYSNGDEIEALSKYLPSPLLRSGTTYQPIDASSMTFENRGSINVFDYGDGTSAAVLTAAVVGDVKNAPIGSINAVGVINDRGNRIDVIFRRIVLTLDTVFGRSLDPPKVLAVLIPNQKAGTAQPSNDITYLDNDRGVKIIRGGDGALFVFQKDTVESSILTKQMNGRDFSEPPPLLPIMISKERRELLYRDGSGINVTTATGRVEDALPPGPFRVLLQLRLRLEETLGGE